MESIKLEDIVPEAASFYLKRTDKEYHLNPVTLSDEIWMQQQFGADLQNILKDMQMKPICRIIFRLMVEEDKEEFLIKEVKFINEEGESLVKRIGGAELLYLCISGYSEKMAIFQALLTTIGVSRPIQKMLTEEEKKTLNPPQTGHKSSTSSPASTGGRQKKSPISRPKR